MNFDWITIQWLMTNLDLIVGFLVVSVLMLFFFPVLLGHDLKKKADQIKDKENV